MSSFFPIPTQSAKPLTITHAGPFTTARLATEALRAGHSVAILTQNREEMLLMKGLCALFTPELSVGADAKGKAPAPVWENPWVTLGPISRRADRTTASERAAWAERIGALYSMGYGGNGQSARGLIATADNLLLRLPPLDFFDGQSLTLRLNEDISPELLLEQLVAWGYQRVSMVAEAGDMARRGDILDIQPPGYEKPLRLEFFGDTVDALRVFDPSTQRSVGQLEEAVLLPVTPIRTGKAAEKKMRDRWARLFQKGLMTEFGQASLLRAVEQQDIKLLPGVAYDAPSQLESWLSRDTLFFLPSRADLDECLTGTENHLREQLEEDIENGRLIQPYTLAARDTQSCLAMLEEKRRVYMEPLLIGMGEEGSASQDLLRLDERAYHSFEDVFPSHVDTARPWQELVAALRAWSREKHQIILAFASDRGRQKFLKFAEEDGLFPALRYDVSAKGLFALVAPLTRQGAELKWDNTLVLGEDILQPRTEKGRAVATGAFKGLDTYDGLNAGDFLVHRDYGIGRFGGLQRMSVGKSDVQNDYLLLEYADNARLYLPVDRLNIVQRFKVSEGTPTLDKLGGAGWSSSKEKAKKAVEKIAADLVEMYAWRKVAKGFSYSPLGEMYREFEASFGFEETPDQAKAIQDVLEDMEKPEPMDRLVCGDVGFGKTEVALRAAFRAACDGKQVALLCPTTVLAEQHFQTFRARLAGFPINVGLLSRFVPKSKQTETLHAVEKGQIDILIGTHRLLSQDVKIPNLGLLVLDEEQRFGVRHKEKLKQLKKNVDALTLTATPIPRTLQLSMSGIRELSVIETAPPERKPVATALINRDKNTLRQILEREIEREGQVFWVHNRVMGLEKVVAFVKELAPHARIGMAHGQMGEKELEGTMHKFWHGELDILVCTAIVESGLDFPRANTLIVDQAQNFGLGQLYQLRGRVGRSDRQAYAYFVLPEHHSLTETAEERLRVILEMDYLGAGFQVAMEDLRIRGAGNILGEAQSGHITRVGLELFLEMLEDAVSRLRGNGELLRTETEINLGLPAHIPETYIADGKERLKYYKMLSTAQQGREDISMELRDRFGPLPEELDTFLAVLDLKDAVNALGVGRADIFPERVRFTFMENQSKVKPEQLVRLVTHHADRAKLFPPAGLELRLKMDLPLGKRLAEARLFVQQLAETTA